MECDRPDAGHVHHGLASIVHPQLPEIVERIYENA
jgi:hypothetical protein